MMIDYGFGMAGVGVGIIAILTLVFSIIIGLVLYLLFAFGLYTMANRRQMQNPWLAFIPLANFYLLGKLIGPFYVLKFQINPPEIILIVAAILYFGIGFIPLVGTILANIALIVILYGLYTLYSRMDSQKSLLYLILSAVFPMLAIPIIFFILKDK